MAIKVVDRLERSTNRLSVNSIRESSITLIVIGCISPSVPANVN